jgi:hypothetical protein
MTNATDLFGLSATPVECRGAAEKWPEPDPPEERIPPEQLTLQLDYLTEDPA